MPLHARSSRPESRVRRILGAMLIASIALLMHVDAGAEPFLGKMPEVAIDITGQDRDFTSCDLKAQPIANRVAEHLKSVGIRVNPKAGDRLVVELNILYEPQDMWCVGAVNLAVIRPATIVGVPGRVSVWNRMSVLYDDEERFARRIGHVVDELMDSFQGDLPDGRGRR